MKQTLRVNGWLLAVAIGVVVQWSTSSLLAATPRPYTNIVVAPFDDFLSPADWDSGGSRPATVDFSTENAGGGGAGSGSLSLTVPWTDTAGGWQETQSGIVDPFPGDQAWYGRPAAPYYTIEYDVKVLSGDLGTDASYGDVQVVLQGWNGRGLNNNDAWHPLGLQELPPSATNWTHFSHVLTGVDHMHINKIVMNFVGQNVTNTATYLVDNVEMNLPSGPPPTLVMDEPPVPGLHFVMGSGYARENIRTIGTNYAWVGAGGPVSYSASIKQYPNVSTYSNFQTHIFLVPNETNTVPNSDPDWTEPTVVRVDIESVNGTTNNPSALATAIFRYKTNAPASNGIFYDAGELAVLESTQILGTWTVTFNSDTSVTLSAPDGSSTNFVFADAPGSFPSDSLRVFYGIQAPSDASQTGQECILDGAAITGTGGGLSDDFTGDNLDPTKWEVAANNSANVFQVGASGAAYDLSWMVPDNLFKLVDATNLADANPWQASSITPSLAGDTRSAVVPHGVPGAEQGYFALVNRTPTKLLVVLPGETLAPGTATGKTGTPAAQTVSNAFEVLVATVDDNWYPTFSSEEIFLESPTAGTNGFSYEWEVELIQGTNGYTVTPLTSGAHTIRALATSDTNNIAEYVTDAYTVNP